MSPNRKFLFSLACAGVTLLLSGAAFAVSGPSLPESAQIDSVLNELSSITGMPVKRRLEFQSITRDEINRYLGGRAKKSIHDKEIEADESALKLLGFVPDDFDLRKMTVDLLTEQAAAFYDYHRKKLFLADWTPGDMRDETVVHELAHALADQNFNLGRYQKKVENDSEQSAAREAVVEGQATYLSLAYAAAMKGRSPLSVVPDPDDFEESIKPSGEFPVFDKAPLYFRATLVFPYTCGMTFQAAVVKRYGRLGFSEVFRNPPVTTQQILHPAVYFAHEKPGDIDLPDPPPHSKALFGADLGELEHRVLIEQYCSRKDAERISPEWRGGGFALFVAKHNDRKLLEYASDWSSETAAAQFFALYRRVVKGKMHHAEIERASDDEFSGRSDGGYFRVWRVGRRVTSIENAAEPVNREREVTAAHV